MLDKLKELVISMENDSAIDDKFIKDVIDFIMQKYMGKKY